MATKQYLASDCSNLLSLRSLLKRDPPAYQDEFLQQVAHLRSLFAIHGIHVGNDLVDELSTANAGTARAQVQQDRHFAEVVDFVAHCLPCYLSNPTLSSGLTEPSIPGAILEMLRCRAATVSPLLRKSLVQSLTMLRNNGAQSSIELMPVLFSLFEIPDKNLRIVVFADLVSNIVRIEENGTAAQKRAHRGFIYDKISNKSQSQPSVQSDDSEIQCIKALGVAVELFRKNVWKDEKTANTIAEAVFSLYSKMSTGALRFLLCDAFTDDNDEDGGQRLGVSIRSALKTIRENTCGSKVGSKKKKRERAIERAKDKLKKADGRSSLGPKIEFGPISMLYDPQSFAERLFSKLQASKDAFSIRQLQMNVISRLINEHQLFLLKLYPFLQRYMLAHVKNVTTIMSFLVQSCHNKIPPDVLEPIIKAIADQFVNDRTSPEAMAIGINSIRAVCDRQPLAMNATLLQDLVSYKDHRDKGVVMAARSLLGLFREINPLLLEKKDRGRPTTVKTPALEYGDDNVPSDIQGVHLILAEKQGENGINSNSEWDEEVEMSDQDEESESDDDDSVPSLMDDDEAAALQKKMAVAENLQRQSKLPLGAVEILTPKDFERLEILQKHEAAAMGKRQRRTEIGAVVDPTELEPSTKQKRRRIEERIALIKANQDERKATMVIGGVKGGNSATNEEKKRKKPFMLTKHSRALRERRQDSQLTKQSRTGSHTAKTRKSAKNSHRRKRRRF